MTCQTKVKMATTDYNKPWKLPENGDAQAPEHPPFFNNFQESRGLMELRHLRYFVAVAETFNFVHAAERLGISQPALSQQIGRLEDEIGVILLWRTRHKVELTPAGEVFLAEARLVLAQVDQAVQKAQRAAEGKIGNLRLGFVGSVLYSFLPQAIRAYRQRYPNVELHLQELSSHDQIEALLNRQIDAGILYGPVSSDEIVTETLLEQPLVAALPEGHPLAQRQTLTLPALAGEPFIALERSSEPALVDRFTAIFQEAGVVPHVVQEARQIQTVLGLVSAGVGLFVMSAYIQNIHQDGVVYVPVAEPSPRLRLSLARRKGETPPVLESFRQVVADIL